MLARLEIRNSGMQLKFINHSYVLQIFLFFSVRKKYETTVLGNG